MPRRVFVGVVLCLSSSIVACAGSQAVRRSDTVQQTLWRWVPPATNAVAWVDMESFRRSSLQELVDNDVDAVQALMNEVGTATGTPSTTQTLMPRLLETWRKLDAVLVAVRSRPPVPPMPPPMGAESTLPVPVAESTDDDVVMLFVARWTAADIDALARAAQEQPAPGAVPASQPAVIEPPPPPAVPAPPGAGATPSPMVPPGDMAPQVETSPLAVVPPPSTPPAEPMVRARVAGHDGWTWGTSALVPLGGGVWVLASRALVERTLAQPDRAPTLEHPELQTMVRDLGLFEQTIGWVGREDSVAQAESLIPNTGLNERAPWPKVIEPGDWFGVGMDASSDVRLKFVVAPSSPSGVNAAETRLRAWRERFAASGFSRLLYLHEAFEEAHVQAVHERVELEAVVDGERASLAYARISGTAITVGVVVWAFISAMGSGLSAMGGLGS